MEVDLYGTKITMHCILCGGTNFEEIPVEEYPCNLFTWFRCKDCKTQFRPNHANKNDPDIYVSELCFINYLE